MKEILFLKKGKRTREVFSLEFPFSDKMFQEKIFVRNIYKYLCIWEIHVSSKFSRDAMNFLWEKVVCFGFLFLITEMLCLQENFFNIRNWYVRICINIYTFLREVYFFQREVCSALLWQRKRWFIWDIKNIPDFYILQNDDEIFFIDFSRI